MTEYADAEILQQLESVVGPAPDEEAAAGGIRALRNMLEEDQSMQLKDFNINYLMAKMLALSLSRGDDSRILFSRMMSSLQ